MSRVQNSGESIAEYVHALKQLARDCEFQQVSADRYRDELTRDSFTTELVQLLYVRGYWKKTY